MLFHDFEDAVDPLLIYIANCSDQHLFTGKFIKSCKQGFSTGTETDHAEFDKFFHNIFSIKKFAE